MWIKDRRGFLLLEIMVSIVIITGGLLFVMRVYSVSKNAIEMSRALFRHSLLLEDAVFGFEEKGEIEKGQDSGEFADAKDYYWDANAASLSETDPNLIGINVVSPDVYRGKKLPLDKYSMATYLNNKKAQ